MFKDLEMGIVYVNEQRFFFFQTCRGETLKTKLRIVNYNLSLVNINIHSLFPSIYPSLHPYPSFETNNLYLIKFGGELKLKLTSKE